MRRSDSKGVVVVLQLVVLFFGFLDERSIQLDIFDLAV